MQSVSIPGDHTSTIRINLGEAFTESLFDGSDADAIGINLMGWADLSHYTRSC